MNPHPDDLAARFIKLSPAQFEVLERAMSDGYDHKKPVGRLMDYGVHITTTTILEKAGLIERDHATRDKEERLDAVAQIDNLVNQAYSHLGVPRDMKPGEWRKALAALTKAQRIQTGILDATAYWITDAGRAALNERTR